jgi:poly(A) polymerase
VAPCIQYCFSIICRMQFWGKRRGIYSNVMGFLGGVNFAILVARICLHYPKANATTIVRSFFKVFSCWTWSDNCPVRICGTDKGGPVASSVWNPELSRLNGKPELFPILTPCYPEANSTFNVSVCPPLSFVQRHCCLPRLCATWPSTDDSLTTLPTLLKIQYSHNSVTCRIR